VTEYLRPDQTTPSREPIKNLDKFLELSKKDQGEYIKWAHLEAYRRVMGTRPMFDVPPQRIEVCGSCGQGIHKMHEIDILRRRIKEEVNNLLFKYPGSEAKIG
jgi:hypothetical protein